MNSPSILKLPRFLALAGAILASVWAFPLHAEEAAAPAEPTLEQRIADLEAYVNNGARTPDVASKIAGPGPGHNAWQMTSTALVLFMTLPGLALFYGGLVRKKNVLSVLAQCLGIAGLVTILWWAVGYNVIAFPLAAGVFYPFTLSPEIAALSMSGSSALVAVNALLLKRTRLGHRPHPERHGAGPLRRDAAHASV